LVSQSRATAQRGEAAMAAAASALIIRLPMAPLLPRRTPQSVELTVRAVRGKIARPCEANVAVVYAGFNPG
jgi:hypothetical protein